MAIIAVLCLALGMDATTAVFTIVDAVVFRPLAYKDSESGAIYLTRFLKSILFAIQPLDLPTFAVTVPLLFGLTLLASWIPARRDSHRSDHRAALRLTV